MEAKAQKRVSANAVADLSDVAISCCGVGAAPRCTASVHCRVRRHCSAANILYMWLTTYNCLGEPTTSHTQLRSSCMSVNQGAHIGSLLRRMPAVKLSRRHCLFFPSCQTRHMSDTQGPISVQSER